MTSHHNLRSNRKGIGTVFGMVFFILIVVIVFASFIIILTQNTGLEQTTIQAKQIDLDRYTELETVSITNPETAVLNNVVYLSCSITNNGTLPTELTRLWIKDITTGTICNVALVPSIVLQPPSSLYYFKSATIAGSSGSDQFAFWFITTRGNSISAYPNINQFSGIMPSGTFPGVTDTNSTYTSDQTLQLSLTTTKTNQLIYVVVSYDDGNTLYTPTSNPSLTWTLRGQSSHTDTYGGDSILKTFYAIMPSIGPITINIQSSADELQDYYCSALAFAISDVNTTSPFDGSAQVSIGKSTMPHDTITTSFSNDLVIGALGIDDLNPTINPGPGFGEIMPVQSSYGASGEDNAMPRSVWSEWSTIVVPTTNLPVNCTFTSTKVWAIIVDAVKLIVTPPSAPVSLSPTSGLMGQQVTVSGQGFAANSNLMASFDGNQIPINGTTDSSGNIPSGAIFTIPRGSTPGNKTVIIMDGKFNYATANFTIKAPSITLTPQTGSVGSQVTVSSANGAYFMPNSPSTVTYDGAIVANYTSTSLGAIPTGETFNVQPSTFGAHTITVTDGFGNFATAAFVVTPSINLNPPDGPNGTQLTITGYGFASYSTITLNFNGIGVGLTSPPLVQTDNSGTFSCWFNLPISTAGNKTVQATDNGSHTASNTFTVTTPSIVLSPAIGSVGSSVTVTGSNFIPNFLITLNYNSTAQLTVPATVTASSTGSFSASFVVRTSSYGNYSVSATDGINVGSANFTVTPSIALSPLSGNVGSTVTISGTGFTASKTITATFAGSAVTLGGTTTTDVNGSFSAATFTVPALTAGAKTVTVTDASSRSGSASFSITPAITLNATTGNVGSTVSVSGTGYAGSSTIAIKYDGTNQTTSPSTVTSLSSGTFSCTFVIPGSSAGSHTISATDTSSDTATAQFAVNQVIQPITVTLSNSAPSATVTVNGFSPSPTTFLADGNSHSITMAAGSTFNLSFTNAGSTRDGFAIAGLFNATSATYTASSSAIAVTAYEQVQNTYSVTFTGGNPLSGDTLVLTGTSVGGASNILTLNVGGVSFASNTSWSDYNTTVTFPASTYSSGANQRWAINGSSSTAVLLSGGFTYLQNYWDQYLFTLSYVVSAGGSPTGPTLSSTQFGSAYTPALSGSATSYWLDNGVSWSVSPNPLSGSSGSERWQTSQTVSGTVSATQTTIFTYYHQFAVTPYYTVSDSSSPTVTNVVSYKQFNSSSNATPTKGSSGGSSIWADAGTAVKYTSPISGSGQRWQVSSADSGTFTTIALVSSSGTTTVNYYDQYQFTLSYVVSGGGSPSAPNLSSTQFGSAYTPALSGSATSYWLDNGVSWSVSPNPLGGSTGSERWQTNQAVSGTVSASQTTIFTFYHQYLQTLSYMVVGGGSPSAPTATGTSLGSAFAPALTTSATAYWYDASGSIAISTPTGTNEQWAPSPSSISATSAHTQVVSMYNQYKQTLSYTVVGGGSPSAPTATGTSLGVAYAPSLTTSATAYWYDASGSITISTPTGTNEQWAPNPSSISAISAHTQIVSMYNQYKQTLSYMVVGGGSPSAPTATGTSLGSAFAPALTTSATAYWYDASGSIAISTPTGTNEQWAPSPSSISATSAHTQVINMYNQYQLTVTASPSGAIGGSFQISYTQTGTTYANQQHTTSWISWADASTTATASSPRTPYNGYSFSSYTNNGATITAATTITLQYTVEAAPMLDKFATGNSLPYYVPITLTNSQNSATSNPFQVKITWNPSSYSGYEAADLGNIRFYSDSGFTVPLYGWLESCSPSLSNTATSATAWVKLTSSIPANGGQTTIYMKFLPASTHFDGNYWGDAPNFSSTYGANDNGASVFNAYFNGNTPISNFSKYSGYTLAQAAGISGPGGATINAIRVTGYNSNNPVFSFNKAMSNAALIAESSFSSPNSASPGTDTGVVGIVNNAVASSVNNAISANSGYGSAYFDQDYITSGSFTSNANPQGSATSSWLYATLTYTGSSATSWSAYIAQQLYSSTGGYSGTVSNNPISSATNLYLGQLSSTASGYPISIYYNFMRARAYPPNNIMPTVSLGAVSGGSITINFPSTSSTGELIVISVTEGSGQSVSSITPSGYGFQYRAAQAVDSNVQMETWWGVSTTSSAQTLTITFSGSLSSASAVAFSVTGANTTTPFDGNPTNGTGTGTTGSVTGTTSRPNDLVIGFIGLDASSSTSPAATGSNTLIGYNASSGGLVTASEYQVVAVPTSNIQSSCSWTNSYNWAIIQDYIRTP